MFGAKCAVRPPAVFSLAIESDPAVAQEYDLIQGPGGGRPVPDRNVGEYYILPEMGLQEKVQVRAALHGKLDRPSDTVKRNTVADEVVIGQPAPVPQVGALLVPVVPPGVVEHRNVHNSRPQDLRHRLKHFLRMLAPHVAVVAGGHRRLAASKGTG